MTTFIWEQPVPSAATLAQLRRTRGREPFTDLGAIRSTRTRIPDHIAARGGTTPLARAEWATMGLWATHQHSSGPDAHQRGVNLGAALGRLGRLPGREAVAERLLTHALTATDLAELAHHIGRAVPLLRQHGIPLDYTDVMWALRNVEVDEGSWARTCRAWALASVTGPDEGADAA